MCLIIFRLQNCNFFVGETKKVINIVLITFVKSFYITCPVLSSFSKNE